MPKGNFVIYVGTFDSSDNTFSWEVYKEFSTFAEANASFKNLCKTCVAYSYEELIEVYDSPRLDIELRQGKTMCKWFGVYEKADIVEEESKGE